MRFRGQFKCSKGFLIAWLAAASWLNNCAVYGYDAPTPVLDRTLRNKLLIGSKLFDLVPFEKYFWDVSRADQDALKHCASDLLKARIEDSHTGVVLFDKRAEHISKIEQTLKTEQYMNVLQRRLKRNWIPPVSDVKTEATVQFDIDRSGYVYNLQVVKSSNDEKFDQRCLAAVALSDPFAQTFSEPITIVFTFTYNASNKSKRSFDSRLNPIPRSFGSTKVAGSKIDDEITNYRHTLDEKVERFRKSIKTRFTKSTIVLFEIARNGSVSNLRNEPMISSTVLDSKNAREIIQKCAPFPPPPSNAFFPFDVEFTFNPNDN